MSDHSLAEYGNRIAPPIRQSLGRRSLSWALVALVHVFFLSVFVISLVIPSYITRTPPPVETMFLLSAQPNFVAPQVRTIRPEVPSATAPVITTAPLAVPPEPPMIQPEAPADILREIGEELACGANSYENLTEAARMHCHRAPWQGAIMPNGVIVLIAPPRPVEQQQVHISGADSLRHEMETGGSGCPLLQQAPCLHDVITGNNMKPP